MIKKTASELCIIAHALNNANRSKPTHKIIYHDKPELMLNMHDYGYKVINIREVPKEKMIEALDKIYGGLKTKSDWKFYTYNKADVDRAYKFIETL